MRIKGKKSMSLYLIITKNNRINPFAVFVTGNALSADAVISILIGPIPGEIKKSSNIRNLVDSPGINGGK